MRRRGSVALFMVVLMAMTGIIVTSMLALGTRDQDLMLRRFETQRSFYTAEAGMAMALRELTQNTDEDGDGVIGGISDDGNDANNPTVAGDTVLVTATSASGELTLVSTGTSSAASRQITAVLESN